jgi:hypothetical protein
MFNLFKPKRNFTNRNSNSADEPMTQCVTLAFTRAVQLSEFLIAKLNPSNEPTLDQKDRVLINNLCLEGVSFRIDLKDMHPFPSGLLFTQFANKIAELHTLHCQEIFHDKAHIAGMVMVHGRDFIGEASSPKPITDEAIEQIITFHEAKFLKVFDLEPTPYFNALLVYPIRDFIKRSYLSGEYRELIHRIRG